MVWLLLLVHIIYSASAIVLQGSPLPPFVLPYMLAAMCQRELDHRLTTMVFKSANSILRFGLRLEHSPPELVLAPSNATLAASDGSPAQSSQTFSPLQPQSPLSPSPSLSLPMPATPTRLHAATPSSPSVAASPLPPPRSHLLMYPPVWRFAALDIDLLRSVAIGVHQALPSLLAHIIAAMRKTSAVEPSGDTSTPPPVLFSTLMRSIATSASTEQNSLSKSDGDTNESKSEPKVSESVAELYLFKASRLLDLFATNFTLTALACSCRTALHSDSSSDSSSLFNAPCRASCSLGALITALHGGLEVNGSAARPHRAASTSSAMNRLGVFNWSSLIETAATPSSDSSDGALNYNVTDSTFPLDYSSASLLFLCRSIHFTLSALAPSTALTHSAARSNIANISFPLRKTLTALFAATARLRTVLASMLLPDESEQQWDERIRQLADHQLQLQLQQLPVNLCSDADSDVEVNGDATENENDNEATIGGDSDHSDADTDTDTQLLESPSTANVPLFLHTSSQELPVPLSQSSSQSSSSSVLRRTILFRQRSVRVKFKLSPGDPARPRKRKRPSSMMG